MTTDSSLIIIPARGGSKGIPRKNIKDFCGRPLIHYSIDVARKIAPDSHIILSTDDEEIREVGRMTGLAIDYVRPVELGGDKVGSREVILDAMDYADRKGIIYNKVVLLQPTSPLRKVEDVEGCIALFSDDTDMVVSVTEAACNPYYDCFETDPDGSLQISKGDGYFTRRQDAPKAWQYNGAVYVTNPDSIRRMPMGEFPRRIPFEMPKSRSVDLDTPVDWIIAENIMNSHADR